MQEEQQKKENDENAENENQDALKEETKPDFEREKLEALLDNLIVMQNDNAEEAPKELDNFDAIEQADDDDEAAFNLMAPQGMNMDSKKEKQQQDDAKDDTVERPVMKMPEDFNQPQDDTDK